MRLFLGLFLLKFLLKNTQVEKTFPALQLRTNQQVFKPNSIKEKKSQHLYNDSDHLGVDQSTVRKDILINLNSIDTEEIIKIFNNLENDITAGPGDRVWESCSNHHDPPPEGLLPVS